MNILEAFYGITMNMEQLVMVQFFAVILICENSLLSIVLRFVSMIHHQIAFDSFIIRPYRPPLLLVDTLDHM